MIFLNIFLSRRKIVGYFFVFSIFSGIIGLFPVVLKQNIAQMLLALDKTARVLRVNHHDFLARRNKSSVCGNRAENVISRAVPYFDYPETVRFHVLENLSRKLAEVLVVRLGTLVEFQLNRRKNPTF